jgi:ABC-2 type transport system permease protein
MRAFLVARKSLLEMLREWQLLLLVVLLPVGFVGITAAGYSAPLLTTHPVLLAGADPEDAPLISELASLRYADGRPIFDLSPATSLDAADEALRDRQVTALLLLSPDDSSITIRGDALSARFYRASAILESTATRYAGRAAGHPERIRIIEQPLGGASPESEFDIYTPGMIIFALLMIIPQTAMLVAREIRWDTLRRLRLTPLRAWELLAGTSLSQMVIAVIQVVVVLLSALLMGFHNHGSLVLAIFVGLIISFSAIGMGLVVACFVENDSQAINVGSTVTMILVFVSGSMYRLPSVTLFTLAGRRIELFDVFPATHGFLALQQVLSYGAGIEEVAFRLGATLVLSLLYFALGVYVFGRLRMRGGF